MLDLSPRLLSGPWQQTDAHTRAGRHHRSEMARAYRGGTVLERRRGLMEAWPPMRQPLTLQRALLPSPNRRDVERKPAVQKVDIIH